MLGRSELRVIGKWVVVGIRATRGKCMESSKGSNRKMDMKRVGIEKGIFRRKGLRMKY